MREAPNYWGRIVEDPRAEVTVTDVMVQMAKQGLLRPFEPDEVARSVEGRDILGEISERGPELGLGSCLDAADISGSVEEINRIEEWKWGESK